MMIEYVLIRQQNKSKKRDVILHNILYRKLVWQNRVFRFFQPFIIFFSSLFYLFNAKKSCKQLISISCRKLLLYHKNKRNEKKTKARRCVDEEHKVCCLSSFLFRHSFTRRHACSVCFLFLRLLHLRKFLLHSTFHRMTF